MLKQITLILILGAFCLTCYGDTTDTYAWRAIIGEASNQGYEGMLAVACGIRNRGHLYGVYGINSPHIDKEPEWVWRMAKKAWEESKDNRIHTGTHWENVKEFGKPYWADSMIEVYRYKDHIFYKGVK